MSSPLRKLAVNAVRLTALAQLGPVGGGILMSGGAIAANFFASSDLAKAAAGVFTELVGGKAADLLGCAAKAFQDNNRNGDLEVSMREAVLLALQSLKEHAPPEYHDWFTDWHDYITRTPAESVFSGSGEGDPVHLQYDDTEYRALWWRHMEPTLVRWRLAENAGFQQLHLAAPPRLPAELAAYLRPLLPDSLQRAHDEVLRNPELARSWIATQQHIYRDLLNGKNEILAAIARLQQPRPDAIWLIPRPTQHFHDRPEILAAIRQAIARRRVTALTALHGLGGIGKTQMARRYAELHRNDYKCGVWLIAESEAGLITELANLAPQFHIAPEPDQQQQALRVLNAIKASEPWLVIFDNAPGPEAIHPWAERLTGDGHLLLTSRNEQWDGLAEPVPITQWPLEESVQYLLRRTGQTDRITAELLARDFDGLALALEHAAAYMKAGDGTSLQAYRQHWQKNLAKAPKGHEYTASVAFAIGLSLKRVQEESAAAYDLLQLLAWLAPDRIPRQELFEAGARALPENLRTALADPDAWTTLIEALAASSLIRRERTDGLVTGYYVHRVVQQLLRHRQPDESWLHQACNFLNAAIPFDAGEPQHWPASSALLPHVRAVRRHSNPAAAPASLGRLLNEMGIYLREIGLYHESRDYRQLALDTDLKILGPDHPSVATSRSNLATLLQDLGDLPAARHQIELALNAGLKTLRPDHPEIAIRRSNLATILRDLGDLPAARQQIDLALAADLKNFGPDHPNVAIRRANLATILRDLGDLPAARQQIELALAVNLETLGPDHPIVATCRSNLATILQDLGDLPAARQQIELALDADLKTLGPDHPSVATSRSNLATILQDLGDLPAARQQIELALDAGLKTLGPDHPSVATRRSNLALILQDLGDLPAALVEIDQALAILRKSLPPTHPNIQTAENNRAAILKRLHPS